MSNSSDPTPHAAPARKSGQPFTDQAVHGHPKYRYELHLHTSEISWCARAPVRKTPQLYRQAGYSGLVLTDHFFRDAIEQLPGRQWPAKIDAYLQSYRLAQDLTRDWDFDVLLGMELRFDHSWNDYLVYGLTESMLKENPPFYEMGLERFFAFANQHDLFVAQAHPFRPGMTRANPRWLHGVEVLNAHGLNNQQALEFAREHQLIGIAGSDYHSIHDVAAATILNRRVRSSPDLARALRDSSIIRLEGPENI